MNHNISIQTDRLHIVPLHSSHAEFILRLFNNKEFLYFIGDKNIRNHDQAIEFIESSIANPLRYYWVVRTLKELQSIGFISLMRKDFLEDWDYGFAFLPEHRKMGFAYESTRAIMEPIKTIIHFTKISAVVMPENMNSMNLLTRLGFIFDQSIVHEKESLDVYKKILKSQLSI